MAKYRVGGRTAAVAVSSIIGACTLFGASRAQATTSHVDYASNVRRYPLFGNNVYDDCSVAAAADLIAIWNDELRGNPASLSKSQAIDVFTSLGGGIYQGVSIPAVLEQWQVKGLAGNKIVESTQLPPSQIDTERAIYYLGGVIGEVLLTPETQLQFATGQNVTSTTPGSDDLAHALVVTGYSSEYLTVVTFGHAVHVSWQWWTANAVAEWGAIPEAFASLGHGPAGTSATTLTSWLGQFS